MPIPDLTDAQIDALLYRLNQRARAEQLRDEDREHYGLPVSLNACITDLRAIVRAWMRVADA